MFKRFISLVVLILLIAGCQSNTNSKETTEDYPNILNVKNIPVQAKDWSAFCMSDHGAWFGFALPPENSPDHLGSFPGPFMMTTGRWLSDQTTKFILKNNTTGEPVNYSKAVSHKINYYPGLLSQEYDFKDIKISMELFFVSNKTAVVKTIIHNKSNRPVSFSGGWRGRVFDLPVDVKIEDKTGTATLAFTGPGWGKQDPAFLVKPLNVKIIAKKENGKSYRLEMEKRLEILPGKEEIQYVALSYFMEWNHHKNESELYTRIAADPGFYFKKNRDRWNGYLNDVLDCETVWAKERSYREIAVKSLMTLINNWRCAYGDLIHDGLFPSYAVSYFNGFWAWDSWKHSVALARFAPSLAKDQIRTMFAYQDQHSMIPDVIYSDSKENNWRDTKPPLSAWAVWEIYQQTGQLEFIKEMYSKVLEYHRWWYKNRDHDGNLLCEYGSTDGTLVAALWESGMDDAVRFDKRKMIKSNDSAWSIDVESVDLNAYLYAEKLYISKMARLLGDEDAAKVLEKDAKIVKEKIQRMMFNKKTGFFQDLYYKDKTFIDAMGPEGWIPLWAGVATPEQAESVKKVMMNPEKFATFIPFPTVSRDNPKFNTGYWRGAVWLDQVYFAVKGLRNYGYNDEADMFTKQLFDRLEGLKDSDKPIRENYDPLTGKGLKVNHFSWSAAHLMLLFRNE